MATLLVDDKRDIPADFVARDYWTAVKTIQQYPGRFDVIYLDHDLGCYDADGREFTGFDFLKYITEFAQYIPNSIVVVTDNGSVRREMEYAVQRMYERLADGSLSQDQQ